MIEQRPHNADTEERIKISRGMETDFFFTLKLAAIKNEQENKMENQQMNDKKVDKMRSSKWITLRGLSRIDTDSQPNTRWIIIEI